MKINRRIITLMIITVVLITACSSVSLLNLPAADPGIQEATPTPLAVQIPAPIETSLEIAPLDAVAAFQGTLVDIYDQVNPSVVNVDISTSTRSGGSFRQGLGSGFVWDTQGHIVTNNHVVAGAGRITVTFADGTSAQASLVGTHPNSDLAVIQVDVPVDELHPVTLADSDQLRVGQLAIAIGNPYGLSGTMTSGIISALSRSLPVDLDSTNLSGSRYSIPDIIQTDASINPGNSGGVLVNDQGQLIGVTAAIQSTTGANSGIGFVIPSNIVNRVVPELIETGSFQQPWIGISGQTLSPEVAEQANLPANQQGALVIDVIVGGPAEAAGLIGSSQEAPSGDVIIAIDDQAVKRFEDMVSYLYKKTAPGQEITLTILRDGEQRTIQLTLGALPTQ